MTAKRGSFGWQNDQLELSSPTFVRESGYVRGQSSLSTSELVDSIRGQKKPNESLKDVLFKIHQIKEERKQNLKAQKSLFPENKAETRRINGKKVLLWSYPITGEPEKNCGSKLQVDSVCIHHPVATAHLISCGSRTCPYCGYVWVKQSANNLTEKLCSFVNNLNLKIHQFNESYSDDEFAFLINKKEKNTDKFYRVFHAIISFAENQIFKTRKEAEVFRKWCEKTLKRHGCDSGILAIHPRRGDKYNKDGFIVEFSGEESGHAHAVVLAQYTKNLIEVFKEDNPEFANYTNEDIRKMIKEDDKYKKYRYVIKFNQLEKKSRILKMITYELAHAGIDDGKDQSHAYFQFGDIVKYHFVPEEKEENTDDEIEENKCPECGEQMVNSFEYLKNYKRYKWKEPFWDKDGSAEIKKHLGWKIFIQRNCVYNSKKDEIDKLLEMDGG